MECDESWLEDAAYSNADEEERDDDDPWTGAAVEDQSNTRSSGLNISRDIYWLCGITYTVQIPNPNTMISPYRFRLEMYWPEAMDHKLWVPTIDTMMEAEVMISNLRAF